MGVPWWADALAAPTATADTPIKGGVLNAAIAPEPTLLTSAFITTMNIGMVSSKILEGLVSYDLDLRPIPALATSWEQSKDGKTLSFAKMVRSLDAAVGQVLKPLDDSGAADNTIVVFTSDNGGERFSKTWPFTGQKSELLEGGLRVPTLLRWPARLRPQVNAQVTITMDWLPTLLAAAGVAAHPDYPSDGQNILPALTGERAPWPRTLYWRYKAQAQRAVRDGDFKYLKINDNEFVFDVVIDQRERANLSAKRPEVLERLRTQCARWNEGFLPITDDVFTHGLTPDIQADRYSPQTARRVLPS